MLNHVRPKTLSGIKSLANDLQRAQGLQRSRALDAAARQAGYENWGHALNSARQKPAGEQRSHTPTVTTWISVYWKDRDSGASGRETLSVDLTRSVSQILTPQQLAICPFLYSMRLVAPDHLSEGLRHISQSGAQWLAVRGARTLQFLDATNLKPSKARSRVYPRGRSQLAVPGRDHASIWYDPSARHYVYLDEPYEGAIEHRAEERRSWAREYGRTILKPRWRGMYNADGGTEAYLISDTSKGYDLQRIADAVDAIVPIPSEWPGESSPLHEPFFTPASPQTDRTL